MMWEFCSEFFSNIGIFILFLIVFMLSVVIACFVVFFIVMGIVKLISIIAERFDL